jgi:hypothetical protein
MLNPPAATRNPARSGVCLPDLARPLQLVELMDERCGAASPLWATNASHSRFEAAIGVEGSGPAHSSRSRVRTSRSCVG